MNRKLKAQIILRFGSQFAFAIATGQHESVVSRVVRGHRELTDEEEQRWSEMLGCSSKEIFQQEAMSNG